MKYQRPCPWGVQPIYREDRILWGMLGRYHYDCFLEYKRVYVEPQVAAAKQAVKDSRSTVDADAIADKMIARLADAGVIDATPRPRRRPGIRVVETGDDEQAV